MAEFDYEVVDGRKIRVRPQEVVSEIDENGYFVRQPNHFTEGFGEGKNPVEKGRYHLVWAKLCHWSNRASIVRELLGLEDVADGSQDFTIIDLAMYNSYMEEFNYDVQKNDIPEDEAKMIAENSYAYYIFPQDQKDLREQVDKALKELKEDGTLTEISKKWYGQDAAPEDDKFEETIN